MGDIVEAAPLQQDSPGRTANTQGKILENTIVPALMVRGLTPVAYSSWVKDPAQYGKELLLRHVPFTTIYGHRGYTEFLIRSDRLGIRVRIECKWQQSSGSVDEKLPYLYLNCVYAMPEADIIIVLGGGGMKVGAVKWLRKAVQKQLFQDAATQQSKHIRICTIEEFLQWANSLGHARRVWHHEHANSELPTHAAEPQLHFPEFFKTL